MFLSGLCTECFAFKSSFPSEAGWEGFVHSVPDVEIAMGRVAIRDVMFDSVVCLFF